MTTDAAVVPNTRKITKLRSVFPAPPSTTADVPLAEQDVTRGTTTTTIDTRKLPRKKPPQPEQRTPNRPMVVAPHSPKVISTPPPTAKRSPPRLEPSAKDSRKKERAFPATIRKPSTVDPPAVTSRTNTFNSDQLPSPNPQRDQPTSSSTAVAAPKSPTPLGLKTGMSVKERVQMFQGSPSSAQAQVRRTDMNVPPQGILTKPAVVDPLEPREQRPEHSDSPDEKLVQTPVRPSRSESSSSTHSPLSTPTRSAASSSTLPFHQTPPSRRLNPYDAAFSLQSQGSIKSHPSSVLDTSDEISRVRTPPRPALSSDNSTSSTATPVQANQKLLSLASSQSLLQSQSSEEIVLLSSASTPEALHRPMGRPAPDHRCCIVQVASAEWDTRVWKYRVLVQKRQQLQPTMTSSTSFTQAFCFRSVPDFFWLEQALAAEFHGALLVPDLRIALQVSQAAMAAETPVDHVLLQDWLSDVLNGYRGAGEWELPDSSSPLLLHQSTSMESFLYKKVLQEPDLSSPPAAVDDKENAANMMRCGQDDQGCQAPNSLVESFSALFPLDLCGVVLPNKEARRSDALATAKDLQMQNSIAEASSVLSGADGRIPSVHSELIRAQRDLAVNYKASSLRCLDCLQAAVNHEERVGLAWRRLAETLGSLFRYESDVDLSDAVRVKYMPFRKLEADVVVDERLHRLVQAKASRGVPALREVQAMLSAYIADFNAVYPAIQAYHRGRVTGGSDSNSLTGDGTAVDEKMSKLRWDDFRDWTRYNAHREDGSIPPPPIKPAESRKRSAANEKLLRQNLLALFQAAPLRRCRMAWKYYSTEARSCSELKTAAAALRSELGVVKPSSVSKLRKRHSRDEKADYRIELDLLQRMVHLGHAQKVQYDSGTESANSASICNEQVEVDNDDLSEERSKAIKRDRALELARQRIGQWNAALATSIMEAVGVEDPNVRVEETTQALRIVRKYAIGLRDRLNRCVEAMDALHDVVEKDRLKESRETFRESLSVVLSGIIKDTGTDISQRFPPASKSTLRVTGIDTNDSFGWMSTNVSKADHLGDMSTQYGRTRDAQIEWLISSLSDLFKEYYQRIEVIEGFVYMECVGIQLEKICSAKRSKALAAFEKKADLTAALAIATRKRMKKVVDEVQAKLRTVDASHTTVKETKEAHLESKAVKSALHSLAVRRLVRARELSTERATTIVEIWIKEEELNAQQEVTVLAKALSQLEQVVIDRIPC